MIFPLKPSVTIIYIGFSHTHDGSVNVNGRYIYIYILYANKLGVFVDGKCYVTIYTIRYDWILWDMYHIDFPSDFFSDVPSDFPAQESRLVIFGGWANKWLDDVWQINVSSIVGPPYAITKADDPNGGQ